MSQPQTIIAIVGPESSGKTRLAQTLAAALDAPWLAEYAREYLTGRPSYDEADLAAIAREQIAREASIESSAPLVIFDTDAIVIEVWWRERFGRVEDWVIEHIRKQKRRHYLLAAPDLPWQPDPLRESPEDRDRLFDVYVATLNRYRLPFDVVSGRGPERAQQAMDVVARVKDQHTL